MIAGFDPVRVNIIRQADYPAKTAIVALLAVIIGTLFRHQFAFPGDRQQVLLDRPVDLFRDDARRKKVDVNLVFIAADIDRRIGTTGYRAYASGPG